MPAFISEVRFADGTNTDFIEIAVPAGTDVSGYLIQTYNNNGTLADTISFDAPTQTAFGYDVYLIDSSDAGFSNLDNGMGVALYDGTSVVQFISFSGALTATQGLANGMTSDQLGSTGSGKSLQSDDGGLNYYSQNSPNPGTITGAPLPPPPPCYASGTLIETPDGARPVETLRSGDLVMTADHGPQPIRWISRTEHRWSKESDKDKPIRFAAGSMGAGLPKSDLKVSPQHKMLIPDNDHDRGVLVPAKAMVGLPKVRQMKGCRQVTYVHLMFDRHEVIFANGTPSESFYPGEYTMRTLSAKDRDRIRSVVLRSVGKGDRAGYPPARPFLKVQAARRALDAMDTVWPEERLRDAGLQVASSTESKGPIPLRTAM